MKTKSVLIVGCGDLGCRVAALLPAPAWRVAGVRRDLSRLPAGIEGYAADYTVAGQLDFIEALQPDYLLLVPNPAGPGTGGYRTGFTQAMENMLAALGSHRPRHIITCSSSRVFAEREGGWVHEGSALASDDARAQAIIDMEQVLVESGHSASVVRFAGIYGAPGGRLLSRVARGEVCGSRPLRYSNRIHRDDCAGFLAHLLCMAEAGEAPAPLYIGVDDEPAPQHEVEQWLAAELGIDPPFVEPAGAIHGRGHKRCSNKRLHDSGYRLLYPEYRSGYRAVIDSQAGLVPGR